MPDPTRGVEKTLEVESAAFKEGESIPRVHTADGPDHSPPLVVRHLPEGTRAIALIVEDPDAPSGTFTHWTLWNLDVEPGDDAREIPANADVAGLGATTGVNDFGRRGWGGPKPPSGTHRYYFKAFALRERLDLPMDAHPDDLAASLEGRVLAWGETMGRYARGVEPRAGGRRR